MVGWGFFITGHSVWKLRVPVEKEGKWKRQRRSSPTESEARSQEGWFAHRTQLGPTAVLSPPRAPHKAVSHTH